MPRVTLTAGGWLGAALVSAALCGAPAIAAPPAVARRATPSGPRPGESEARRREEIDALQRQDAAEALKKHFNIDVDWKTTPLDRLVDIRVRAAKAVELQQRLGVSIDWQRYSWIELEALRRTLISFEEYRGEPAPRAATAPPPRPAPAAAPARPWPGSPTTAASIESDGLVRPTFKDRPAPRSGHSTDPDGVLRPTFNGRADGPAAIDPDGVIRPTFAVPHRWSAYAGDPDGLIAPTFVPYRRLAAPGDTDDLMDPTRTFEGRTVPARW